MCDLPSVSNEHVPPKGLFPESKDLPEGVDLRKKLITVKSCVKHNTEKSGDDAYFLSLLAGCDFINEVGREHYRQKVRRQHTRNNSILARFGDRLTSIHGRTGIVAEINRLDSFVVHMAAALYYAHFGTRWSRPIEWIPEFLVRPGIVADMNRRAAIHAKDIEFDGMDFIGENPEVFKYQVRQDLSETTMRLHFYDGCRISLAFREVNKPSLVGRVVAI
jgi:hypothetical protein